MATPPGTGQGRLVRRLEHERRIGTSGMKTFTATPRADLYTRVTERVITDLEKGVRPWLQPWNAGHAAGRITLPRRHNGLPYRGINILLLWGEAGTTPSIRKLTSGLTRLHKVVCPLMVRPG